MGCNTSQEQTQSTAKGNADADVQDESKCNNESQPQDTQENTEKQTIDGDKKHNSAANSTNIATSEDNKNSNCLVSSKNEGTNHTPALDAKNACDDEEDESKAATKIQAVFRGHKVRATMKKAEQPSTTQKGNESAKAEPERAVTPSKADLEAEFDPNDQELCHAATRIQAAFRGHLHRRIAGGEQQEDVDMNEITKKVAEELDIDLTDPELNKAATKIQASFRGHKIRKDIGTVNQ